MNTDTITLLAQSIKNLDTRIRALANREQVLQTWQPVTLVNAWADAGAPYSTPGYWKDPYNIVHLRGTITTGTAPSVACTLPAGYKPEGTLLFSVPSGSSVTSSGLVFGTLSVPDGIITIASDGAVTVTAGTTVSLDGITFRAYS